MILLSSGLPRRYWFGEVDEAVEEFLVDVLVHVDALDAAAGLAGVEHGAVDQVLDGVRQVGVGADISRIAAAELEAEADEALGRGLHDGMAGRHRAGEVHVVDAVGADQLQRVVMRHVQVLEQAPRAGRRP